MASAVTRGETGWSNAAEDRIELADPDPSWPEQFEAEAVAIRRALGFIHDVRLEHFGSTAVPNLRAKPVIDILLIHPKAEDWPQLVQPAENLGYVFWSGNPRKDRMFFVKGMPPFGALRTHHLHVRAPEDAEDEMRFRDLLRADPALARDYERLKQRLSERFPADRDAYTSGKSAFVARALGGYAV